MVTLRIKTMINKVNEKNLLIIIFLFIQSIKEVLISLIRLKNTVIHN